MRAHAAPDGSPSPPPSRNDESYQTSKERPPLMENMESVDIQDPGEAPPSSLRTYFFNFNGKNRLILGLSGYSGPYESTQKLLSLLDIGYQGPLNPSTFLEAGVSLGLNGEANPLFHLSYDNVIRNSWKYLRAGHLDLQLEWDSALSFPSIIKISQFSFGGGYSFSPGEDHEFRFSLLPFSTRGWGMTAGWRWIFSGF